MLKQRKELLIFLAVFVISCFTLIYMMKNRNKTESFIIVNNESVADYSSGEQAQFEGEATFYMDLNKITKEQLMMIDGIGEKTAEAIINYRTEHNGFKNMEELLEVKNIGEMTLSKLKNYVYVKNPTYVNISGSKNVTEETVEGYDNNIYLNINTATVSELEKLSSIGEVKARAIIDYRNTKGYFYSIEEIKNVDMIGEATFEIIKDYIYVDKLQLPKNQEVVPKLQTDSSKDQETIKEDSCCEVVNINTATKEELLNVPGMKEIYAQKIIEHRQQPDCLFVQTEEIIVVCYKENMSVNEYNIMREYLTV